MNKKSLRVKKWVDSKRKPCPGNCGSIVHYQTILCRKCYGKEKLKKSGLLTIQECKDRMAHRWKVMVRNHAKYVFRDANIFECICRYNKHIEVAHIKAVSKFDNETTLAEINALENLIGLCPNCHWEYDNGLLVLNL